ncbi:MAG: hypothetical protein SO230_07770 [Sodaliphilus sp.]|nr:hypothetical protein [Sodaliphilus sp.]
MKYHVPTGFGFSPKACPYVRVLPFWVSARAAWRKEAHLRCVWGCASVWG